MIEWAVSQINDWPFRFSFYAIKKLPAWQNTDSVYLTPARKAMKVPIVGLFRARVARKYYNLSCLIFAVRLIKPNDNLPCIISLLAPCFHWSPLDSVNLGGGWNIVRVVVDHVHSTPFLKVLWRNLVANPIFKASSPSNYSRKKKHENRNSALTNLEKEKFKC